MNRHQRIRVLPAALRASSTEQPVQERVRVRVTLNESSSRLNDNTKGARAGKNAYKTGFRRPPLEHQWKPGQSGNKKGRPKRKKLVGSDLFAAKFEESLPVSVNGKQMMVTYEEAAILLQRKRATEDPKVAAHVTEKLERIRSKSDRSSTTNDAEVQTYQEHLARMAAERGKGHD